MGWVWRTLKSETSPNECLERTPLHPYAARTTNELATKLFCQHRLRPVARGFCPWDCHALISTSFCNTPPMSRGPPLGVTGLAHQTCRRVPTPPTYRSQLLRFCRAEVLVYRGGCYKMTSISKDVPAFRSRMKTSCTSEQEEGAVDCFVFPHVVGILELSG